MTEYSIAFSTAAPKQLAQNGKTSFLGDGYRCPLAMIHLRSVTCRQAARFMVRGGKDPLINGVEVTESCARKNLDLRLRRPPADEFGQRYRSASLCKRTGVNGTLLTFYVDAAAARSAILASTNSRRKRCVRSTNVSLSARQVSNSRLTP